MKIKNIEFPAEFHKYQSTGNDFVLFHSEAENINLNLLSEELISRICHRRFGIGSDGLIIVETENDNINMIYYNSDGKQGSMCGNGGRSVLAFLHNNGLWNENQKSITFTANGKFYKGTLHQHGYALKMTVPSPVEKIDENVFFTDTGSPHVVILLNSINDLTNDQLLRSLFIKYRYHLKFNPGGTNVNFIFLDKEEIRMRTYERGVEDETLSCGTGTVAVSWVLKYLGSEKLIYKIFTPGGILYVEYIKEVCNDHKIKNDERFTPILIGNSICTFVGRMKNL